MSGSLNLKITSAKRDVTCKVQKSTYTPKNARSSGQEKSHHPHRNHNNKTAKMDRGDGFNSPTSQRSLNCYHVLFTTIPRERGEREKSKKMERWREERLKEVLNGAEQAACTLSSRLFSSEGLSLKSSIASKACNEARPFCCSEEERQARATVGFLDNPVNAHKWGWFWKAPGGRQPPPDIVAPFCAVIIFVSGLALLKHGKWKHTPTLHDKCVQQINVSV